MKSMRNKYNTKALMETSNKLSHHPWYPEFMDKVVNLNGAKTDLTQDQRQLLNEITCYIQDGIPFKKQLFIDLMKTVPKNVFPSDEIQRIFRFIKTRESISERDYVEAVEIAGH